MTTQNFFRIKFFIVLFTFQFVTAQNSNPQLNKEGIRVMFYNVENLFHPSDDPIKNDDEFTEKGTRYWSFNRYYDKINKIGKTVLAIGEWEPPAVIGLCEVENIQCLKDLVYNSPLKTFGYEIIHQESDDNRGIDVAMLYRPEHFELIGFHAFKLNFPMDSRPSRDILYAKGLVGKDTLHFFVNHWPSRYGGQLATAPKREFAAEVLRSKFDSIMNIVPNAAIIAMGDFNDHPDDKSMSEILKAKKDTFGISENDLINLIWQFQFKKGTHKFQHEWGILDQFVITQAMTDGRSKIKTGFEKASIFDAEFLVEEEGDGMGKTPNRTYIGFKYHGGYSDHLPIFLDLILAHKKRPQN